MYISLCCSSVAKLCPTPCNLKNYSMPSPILQYLSRVCSNSYPLRWWCYLAISSSVAPFSFFPQSLPEVGSFPVSRLFTLGGQSIRASALASVLPMNIQDWFPLGLTVWCPRDSQESSPTPQVKSINPLALNPFYGPTLTSIHDYWKNCSFDSMDLCCLSNVSAF